MGELSIIELIFYGFVELFSFSMLAIAIAKPQPDTKSQSLVRAVYAMPGMIMAGFLVFSGITITMDSPAIILTNNTITNETGDLVFTEITNSTIIQPSQITLVHPIWMLFHFMIFIVLLIYVFTQIMDALVKKD